MPIRPIALSRFFSSNSSSTIDLERAAVAQELLERPGQAAVAVGEVRAQGALERERGLLVDRFGLAHQLLELGPHDVDVDRDAGVLEGQQADPDSTLEERGAVVGRPLGKERGERPVVDDEPLDDDPLPVEADTRRGLGRVVGRRDGADRTDGGCVHDPNGGGYP